MNLDLSVYKHIDKLMFIGELILGILIIKFIPCKLIVS